MRSFQLTSKHQGCLAMSAPATTARVDAAVAHCARNEQGLLRLADLWASRTVSNWNLNEVCKKNLALSADLVKVQHA